MNRTKKIAVVAGAAAALAVAGSGVAIAADALTREEQSKAVIDDAAEQLGVEPSELSAALKSALKNRVDEAVEAGKLTTEQADALKERIDSAALPLLGGFGNRGFGRAHLAHPHSLGAAASFLGMSQAALEAELIDGKSLADVAKAEGKSVAGLVQALVADAKKRLDEAVDDGELTQAQADEIGEDLEERITEFVYREPGSGPGFRGNGLGAGPDHFRSGHPGFPGAGFVGPRA